MEKLFSGLSSAIRLFVSGLPGSVAPSHKSWTESSQTSLRLTLSTVRPLDSFPIIFIIVVGCVASYIAAQMSSPGG